MAKTGNFGRKVPCDNQGLLWGLDNGGQICGRQSWASSQGFSSDALAHIEGRKEKVKDSQH